MNPEANKNPKLYAPDVLYEDNHLIVVNKKPTEIVQGDKSNDIPLLENVREYIRVKYNKPGNVFTGLVHRLDRPASGALIFAKTGKGLSRMNELLKKREIKKIYWAVVGNPPPESGKLSHFMKKNNKQNKSYTFEREVAGSRKAELSYRLLAASDNYYLLEIDLHTGRHHQIRAQLAAIGCPVKGDLKYGAARSNPDGSIHLHARQVFFTHPVKKELLEITAPVPEEKLWQFFEKSLKR